MGSRAGRGGGSAWVSLGALLAGASVALAAYASHGASGAVASRLQLAAALAFGHGIALCALAAPAHGTRRWVAGGWALGTVLFSGSLAAAHFLGTPTRLAPAGGMLLIAAWLLLAATAWRGR